MKKHKKILALILALVFMMSMMSIPASAASTTVSIFDESELPGLINTIASASPGDEIIVTGDLYVVSNTISLNIPAGVTVRWQIFMFSFINAYIFEIGGSGTFVVESFISSNGTRTAGAINLTGAVTLEVDSWITADNVGNPILVSADNATVNVGPMGYIISYSGNSNAAIQVGRSGNTNIMGTAININGGSVLSDVGGYAINDGAGTGTVTNNTVITVNGGIVSAGSACAIHSTGIASSLIVNDGVIVNSAASNANPTVYINGDPNATGQNIITINGGLLQNTATGAQSYTMQTTGDIIINGGVISTINGRAINLVGVNSKISMNGGSVQALGTGTAICTATTAGVNVSNTAIEISGGEVFSSGGNALRITGANTLVNISGGAITSSSPDSNVLQVDSSATSAIINISGGAVDALSSGSAVFVTGAARPAINVSGGRVTAKTGYAIRTGGDLNLSGGFVFAYRAAAAQSVSAGSVNVLPGSEALVVAWNQGGSMYEQGRSFPSSYPANRDLTVAYGGDVGMVFWDFDLMRGPGIRYAFGSNTSFFSMNWAVLVVSEFGLVYDAEQGLLFRDVYGQLSLFEYYQDLWTATPNALVLDGLSWVTSYPVALRIIGDSSGSATIVVNEYSRFESVYYDTGLGIDSSAANLTISGSGTLVAVGADAPLGRGIDIGGNDLIIEDGTFIALGGQRAIHWADADSPNANDTVSPQSPLYRWLWSKSIDGRGDIEYPAPGYDWGGGIGPQDPFRFFNDDRFVMLQSLSRVTLLDAVQIGGASGVADSTAIMLTFSAPVSWLSADDITVSGAAYTSDASVVSGDMTVWLITLGGVSFEGFSTVQVSHFGEWFIENNIINNVQIFKALEPAHRLTLQVNPPGSGNLSMGSVFNYGSQFQEFLADTFIEITAAANSGFRFSHWTADGVALNDSVRSSLVSFNMPGNNVTLTAHFVPHSTGGGQTEQPRNPEGPRNEGEGNNAPRNEKPSGKGADSRQPEGVNDAGISNVFDTSRHIRYIQGVGNNLFHPNRDITRAEVAQIFYNLLLNQDVEITHEFPDMPSGAWHETAVNTLASLGILNGYPDGTFRPDAPITRAEFVTAAARFSGNLPDSLDQPPFPDVSAEHWASNHISAAVSFGWISGYTDGSFRPDSNLNRAETVTIVNRMLGRVPDRQAVSERTELNEFDDVPRSHWAFYDITEAFEAHDYLDHGGVEVWQ